MQIETKIARHGNSFAFPIPKALVECDVLKTGKKYKLVFIENDTVTISQENGYIPFRSPDLDTFINKGVLA